MYSPLKLARHAGGTNRANWPLELGVEVKVLLIDGEDEAVSGGVLSRLDWLDELEVLDVSDISSSGLGSSAKQFVVAQNKKFPRMLPWGLPPGASRGVERASLTLTDIVRPCRNDATQSMAVSEAPRSERAFRHSKWSILLNAFSKSIETRLAAVSPSSRDSITLSQVSSRKCSVPHPLTPPYCLSLSFVSVFRYLNIKFSNFHSTLLWN